MKPFFKTTGCCLALLILISLCCASAYADTTPFSMSVNHLQGIAIDLAKETTKQTVAQMGVAPIPEPGTMLLFGTGVASLAAALRKRRRSK